jgi:hypothetical protein
MRKHFASVVLASAALAAVGCSKPSADSSAPGAAAAVSVTASAAASAPPAPAPVAVVIDPEVQRLLAAVVAGCKVEPDSSYVSDCKNKEQDALRSYATDKKPAGFYGSIAEIAMTDGQKDPKLFAAAVATVGNVDWGAGPDWMKDNASYAGAADRFVQFLSKVKDGQTLGVGSVGDALPILGGKKDALVKMINGLKPGRDLRKTLVMYLLDAGGAAALPDLDAFMKSTTNSDDRYSGAWAVGVAVYQSPLGGGGSPPPSDADKTTMCDWAKGYAKDADARTANGAIDSLGRCKGAYIDAALDAIEAQVKPGSFPDALSDEFKTQCWSEGFIGFPSNGTADQCARAMGDLEKISNDKTLSDEDRGRVVFVVSVIGKVSQGPTRAKAKAILTRFTADKSKNVADQARGYIKDMG